MQVGTGQPIHFGSTTTQQPPQAAQGGLKRGQRFVDMFKRTVENELGGGGGGGGTALSERLIRGIKRTLSKTFLRPRGYLELIGGFLMGGVPALFFLGKHFTEGFLGVNSLFMPRLMKFTPKFWNSNNEYNTLLSMMKGQKNAEYVAKHGG